MQAVLSNLDSKLYIFYETFFGRWQYSVLRKVCLFLIHTMWLPGSHSAHFFLYATSKGFFPHIQKVGITLHSLLEFAPKSSLSHPGDDVWSKELCSAAGCSWDRPPKRWRLNKGSGGMPQPSLLLFHSPPPLLPHFQITISPTCSAFLWDCRWECRRLMRGTPFRACRFNSQ